MEKYTNTKGEVGVIISTAYGSGWSTWASNKKDAEYLMFQPQIVDYLTSTKNIEPEEIKKMLYGLEDTNFSIISDEDYLSLEVVWIKSGQLFYIENYDGIETVITEDMMFFA